MEIKNAKRLISVLLAFVLTLSFSITIVNVLALNNKEKNNIPVSAAYIYIDSKSSLSDSEYNDNGAFWISKPEGLINLAKIVDSDARTFAGKLVVLKSDLNMSGYTFEPIGAGGIPFCGRFIAQRHTISNLTIRDDYERSYLGLFYELSGSAEVENLRLQNVKLLRNYYSSGGFVAAALSTYVSGSVTISGVEVSGLQVYAENSSSCFPHFWVAGIVGGLTYDEWNSSSSTASNVSITDCYVENFDITMTVTSGSWAQLGHYTSDACVAGIGPVTNHYYNGDAINQSTTSSCIFKKSDSSWNITESSISVHKEDIAFDNASNYSYKYGGFLGIGQSTATISGTDLSAKISNCYAEANLSYDGMSIDSETYATWFYDSTFNDGYPKLQMFTSVDDARYDFYYNYKNVTKNHGYVKDNSGLFFDSEYNNFILLFQPDHTDTTYVSDVLDINYSSSRATLKVGDKELVATPESEFYEFSHWTYVKDTTSEDFTIYQYTAHFKPVERTVLFKNASGTVAALTNPISPSSSTTYTIYYGTEISVSHQTGDGAFTLTYTFQNTSGSTVTVTYNITAEYKLTSADWNNGDKLTVNSQIQPVVTPKLYTVTFKGNADTSITTAQTWQVYYGTNITYGISNNEVTFTSNKTLNSGTSPVKYSPKNSYYTFEYLKVNSTTYTTGGTISNITANKTIEVSYLRWYDVTFTTSITGVASSSGLNGKTNPVKLRKGSEIKGNYTGYAGKTLTYTATYGGESTEIFRYTIANYYIVTNTDDINNLDGTDLTITPTLEFYACTVTMGDISSTLGTRSGYTSPFIVEYGTIVKFTATQTNSIFTYTYTFTYGGSIIKTITYTMKSNQYAMTSTVNGDHRVWHTDIGSNNAVEYEVGRTNDGTAMTISPTFGLKEYSGDLN